MIPAQSTSPQLENSVQEEEEETYDSTEELISSYHFASGTATERVKLASKLMLLAPPSELEEIFQNLRIIIHNDDEMRDGIGATFDQYSCENFVSISLPSCEYRTLLTSHNRLKEHLYFDPNTMRKFLFNPFDDSVQLLNSLAEPTQYNDLRSQVQAELDSYLESHYPSGVGMVIATEKGLAICISAIRPSPNNYWNGQWISEWILNIIPNLSDDEADPGNNVSNPPSATLQGTFSIKVHYFEAGNVQLFASTGSLVPLDDGTNVQEMFQAIAEEESKFQNNLNASYDSFSETTFKTLRRALPVTKSKLDWDKIFAYKLGTAFAIRSSPIGSPTRNPK